MIMMMKNYFNFIIIYFFIFIFAELMFIYDLYDVNLLEMYLHMNMIVII
jgi:hypothetical protein